MANIQIFDTDFVLRRVPTFLPNYVKEDGSISSLAFAKKRDEDGLSVDLERLSSFEKATLNDKRFRLMKINVGLIRNNINDGLDVLHNPIENHPTIPDNDAHCLIIGHITGGKQKQLLKNAFEIFE